MDKRLLFYFFPMLILAGLPACCTRPATSTVAPPPSTSVRAPGPSAAVAELNPTQGSSVRGKVSFLKVGNSIRVVADVTGLTPGKHGFHIHEKGDCSAPDGSSAGGHFNPYGMPHAGMDADHATWVILAILLPTVRETHMPISWTCASPLKV